MADHHTYLGDGVYARFAAGTFVLTTENRVSIDNTIFLEPDVLAALARWVRSIDPALAARIFAG